MPITIDLCDSDDDAIPSPPPPPVRQRVDKTTGVIEILDDDDDDAPKNDERTTSTAMLDIGNVLNGNGKRSAIGQDNGDDDRKPAARKKKVKKADPPGTKRTTTSRSEGNSDVTIVAAPPPPVVAAAAAAAIAAVAASNKFSSSAGVEDEECMIIGRTGKNSLSDFPHARSNCVEFPIADDPLKHCVNCYCFVCDELASSCTEWANHCRANYDDARWRILREQKKKGITSTTTPPAAASRSMLANNLSPMDRDSQQPRLPGLQQLLQQQQQQQQQLQSQRPCPQPGFFQRLQRLLKQQPQQPQLQSQRPPPQSVHRSLLSAEQLQALDNRPDLDDYASNESLLRQIACVFPSEKTPPASFVSNLRHYQKQSLAFMIGVEKSRTANLNTQKNVRGGWLASEVGMGKTAVILALVQSNPSTKKPPKETIEAHLCRPMRAADGSGSFKVLKPLKLKTTIVVTSVSLMGQWEEECKKHSPSLKVKRYHPSTKASGEAALRFLTVCGMATDLADADILVTTATFAGHHDIRKRFRFHRVVVDESHLIGSSSMNEYICRDFKSSRRWCVTATPFTKLHKQRGLLSWEDVEPMSYRFSQKQHFYLKVDHFRKVMTRHDKGQRINGVEALALPESTTSVLYVNMDARERRLYDSEWNKSDVQSRLSSYSRAGARAFAVETQILARLSMNSLLKGAGLSMAQSTKVQAITNDVRLMLANDPKVRIVVYSQYIDTARAVVAALQRLMKVHSFDGSTSATKRDQAIREFQTMTTDSGGAAFVITLRSGSVGITLTTASRVYLMEPCIDTAKEVQAAGRIHRLGQTKNVEVKKMIYRNSTEENIQLLQRELIAGRIKLGKKDDSLPPAAMKILSEGRSGHCH